MGKPIGVVFGWESDLVKVLVTEHSYLPSMGDLLYTVEAIGGSATRFVVMEVVGFTGGIPSNVVVPQDQVAPQYYLVQREVVVHARLFLEVVEKEGGSYLSKASRPPTLRSYVYLLKAGDSESEKIMKRITEYSSTSGSGIAIAMLRSGVSHSEADARERHFENAYFSLDIGRLLPKHILVAGQTGSGKTSSLMGLLVKYALESRNPIGWLIIDRHGEYTPKLGYEEGRFIAVLVNALLQNPSLSGVRVRTYRLTYAPGSSHKYSTYPPYFDLVEASIRAGSITLADFVMLEETPIEQVANLEEFIATIAPVLKNMEEHIGVQEQTPITAKQSSRFKVAFHARFLQGDSLEAATGNVLALIPILVDNLVRYEGVGKSSDKERTGLHKVLVERGIYVTTSRALRRLVLSRMRWKMKPELLENRVVVYVLDDSNSIVKVPETFKKPEELVCFLEAFLENLRALYQTSPGSQYSWKIFADKYCRQTSLIEVKGEEGIDVSDIVSLVERGGIAIVDVSEVDNVQGDLVAITLARRLFEHRMELGVEEASKSIVGIISEEAPLYLSHEKVKTPFNPFARIAREGRKFNIGLVAVTQMATLIDKQILANFNTMIILRTKSRSDLELFKDLGVPAEVLPFLGDREGFLYTPEMPIKEPVPVYFPAWFEYKKLVEQPGSKAEIESRSLSGVGKKLAEKLKELEVE